MPELKIGQSFPDELAVYNVRPSYWWDVWTGEVTFLPEVPQPVRDVVLAVLTRHVAGPPIGGETRRAPSPEPEPKPRRR